MSLKVHLYDSRVTIAAHHFPPVLAAVNSALAGEPSTCLDHAFGRVGMSLVCDARGDVASLALMDDYFCPKLPEVLRSIASYTKHGDYLLMSNDNGDLWQYAFLNRSLHVRTFPPGFVLPTLSEINDMNEAHELLDSAGVPRRARGKTPMTLTGRLSILLSTKNISESRTS